MSVSNGLPKRVAVFTTGGTISSTDGSSGAVPTLHGADIMRPEHAAGLDVAVHDRTPVPSSWLTIEGMIDIARAIDEAAADGADAALVVQGTDTLEETGFVLELARASSIPVALTGAMRIPQSLGADGPANIGSALTWLASAPADTTVVVMNDEVHLARSVRKTDTASTAAFRSPHGPIAVISEGSVVPVASACPLARAIVKGLGVSVTSVLHLTSGIGEHFEWLPDVMSRYGGLVLSGSGAGHAGRLAAERIAALAHLVPVVVASRTGGGPTLSRTYGYVGSEMFFAGAGAHLSRGLDGLRARLLLSLVPGGDDAARTMQHYRSIEAALLPVVS